MTALLILAFNRPDLTEHLCRRLVRLDADLQIYVSIDGPRERVSGELESVLQVRTILRRELGNRIVDERVSAVNLGCADAVMQGIQWFFSQVDEGIILEDDCIPSAAFLEYCDLGLKVFRDDESVASLCGVNYAPSSFTRGAPLVRSMFQHLWGWATWRRATVGFRIRDPQWRERVLTSPSLTRLSPLQRRDWLRWFSVAEDEQPHTWDFQWVMHQWSLGREAILPSIPLVQNIGFNGGAHHSAGAPRYYFESDPDELSAWEKELGAFPLRDAARSEGMDRWIARNIYSPSVRVRAARRVQRVLSRG